MKHKRILISVCSVALLMLVALLCLAGCKKQAPTVIGLNVRYRGAETDAAGITIPVAAGDTAESLLAEENFLLILRLSDGTTKELRLGEENSRLECTLTGTVEANSAYTCKVIYGDYAVTLTFVAPPATPTLKINKNLDKTYDGVPASLGAGDMEIVGESTPVITWYEQNEDGTYRLLEGAPVDVGEYKVTLTLAESTHFTAGEVEKTFAIRKAEPGVAVPTFPNTFYEDETPSLSDITLPAGYAWAEGQTLTLGRHDYQVVYTPADTRNYATVTVTADVTCRRRLEKPTIRGTYTYDPNADAVLALDGFDEATMQFYVLSDDRTQKNAGTYTIRVYFNDAVKYCWSDKTVEPVTLTWRVEKRTEPFTGTAPSFTGTYAPGMTLASFAFEDSAHWRWEADDTPVTCDRTSYTALWCPAGFQNDNYLPTRVTVTVTVARASAWDDTMTPGTIEVYDDTVTSLSDIDPNAGFDRTRGTLRFEEGQTLTPGRSNYRLYFVPADAVNYRVVHNIEVEICYRAVLPVPVIGNDMTPTRGLDMTILMTLEGYDENLMEAVDKDGHTMWLEQSNAGVYTYYFRLKDTDAYAWEGHTTADREVVWTITPLRVARPTPVKTVAVLDGSGGIEFSWNGWTSDFDGATVGTTHDRQLPDGKFTAMNAGIYYVCVSLRDKINTVWEDGTTDDFTIAFTVLDADPVTSVTKNGKEIGLDGWTTAELIVGETIVIRTADGYTAYVGDTVLSDAYTVPGEVGKTPTFSVRRDSDGKTVYSVTKTVLSPFTELEMNGKSMTFGELADAIMYGGGHFTYTMRGGYCVQIVLEDGTYQKNLSECTIDMNWGTFTLRIVRDDNEEICLFSHTYPVQYPILSITVDGVEKDVRKVLAGEITLPVGGRMTLTLPDGYTVEIGNKTYASGDAIPLEYHNNDLSLYRGSEYLVHLYLQVGLAERITVNGKEIDGSYEMTPDDENLVFRIVTNLPVEWSAEYADGTDTPYLAVTDGTFTVPARGLVSVRLSFELKPHDTAGYGISIYTYTNIDGISALMAELGQDDLVMHALSLMTSGNNADYELPWGFIGGLHITYKDGFTGTYRVRRTDGTVIDENGTWVNGGYGDVLSLGWFLRLEILDDTGAVAETRTLRYNVQQSVRFTGAARIETGASDDPAYLYTVGCTLGTAYDAAAWNNVIFGDRGGREGRLPTAIVNGGETITFTVRDVYTLDCVIVFDLGDGRRFEYRTELVVNLTEGIENFLDNDGFTIAERGDGSGDDVTASLSGFYENRYDVDSKTVACLLQNGFVVKGMTLKEGYTLSEHGIIVRNRRAYLRLVFTEDATGTTHTVLAHLVSYTRFDDNTTVDAWRVGQFGNDTGTVTPDGDTLTLEDFDSTKYLLVSPRSSAMRVRLYDGNGKLLREEYGSTEITFPTAGTYTLTITSTDGTVTATYTIVVTGDFAPLFEVIAGEGDGERRLWADNSDGEEMPIGNCYLYNTDDSIGFIGYFGRDMQAFITLIDGVEYLPVRLRSSLAGHLYADEDCTVPLAVGEVNLRVLTEAGRRYVEAYALLVDEIIPCRFYLEENTYPATIAVGDTEYNLRMDPNLYDFGDAVMGEDGFVLTVPASASEVTTVTLKLTRVYADESYTVIDHTTGKVYRVADQDTLTVEIPVTFGEDGYVLLMICPEGSTDLTSNVYPLLIVLAAE